MTGKNYTVRTMTRKEIDLAVEWAAAEGWNPGLHDAGSFYAADPNGFFVGVLDDEPVAAVSAVKYGGSFGFMGFYIVKPEHRGKGFGIKVWNAGMSYLHDRTIGLDGVVAQQDNYKKLGFSLAYRNIRHKGTGGGRYTITSEIVPLSEIPVDDIIRYDEPFFPDDRKNFLKSWITRPDSIGLGIVHNGAPAGYGIIRPCRSGYKIGPLFADSPERAGDLFLALKMRVPDDVPVFLDTPEVNAAAVALASRYSMRPMFETARMYAGNIPGLPIDRLFGVTTFELG